MKRIIQWHIVANTTSDRLVVFDTNSDGIVEAERMPIIAWRIEEFTLDGDNDRYVAVYPIRHRLHRTGQRQHLPRTRRLVHLSGAREVRFPRRREGVLRRSRDAATGARMTITLQ